MSSKRKVAPMVRRPLSADELHDLQEQFDACDADGDQRISFTEFSELLENLGSELLPEQRRSRFDEIDLDRNGLIDRDEFLHWWRAG